VPIFGRNREPRKEFPETDLLFEDMEDGVGLSQPDSEQELPMLPLRGVVVYPMMWLPLTVAQPRSIRLIDEALGDSEPRIIGLVTSKNPENDQPTPDEIYDVGTIAVVHRMLRAPDGTIRLIVQGLERIRIDEYTESDPYLRAKVTEIPDVLEDSVELQAMARNAQEQFRQLISLVPHLPEELEMAALNVEDARQLVYLIASSLRLDIEDAQELLEADSVTDKLRKLMTLLTKELEVLELGRKIQSEAVGEMEKVQRDFYLREQLKAIQKELGEEDEQETEIKEMEKRIAESGMSEEAVKEAKRELDRMHKMPIQAAEYSVIKTYLDWMVSLPWQQNSDDNLDITHARQVLDEDHYGLGEIKDRILEYLAVRKLKLERKDDSTDEMSDADMIRREREGVILCFVGPPGVGKTSLGRSIARAMGREFVRVSLGGVRDEAEIRGHRRTYVGAMPGRIIHGMKQAATSNPVMMLDEIDKLGADFRGDPSAALLEVLDPEQNAHFSDHFVSMPFDLSRVLFIATANVLDPVPGPLRDRMEVIRLSGYTPEEKVEIATRFLVPRQISEHGLIPSQIKWSRGAVEQLTCEYTHEAGVRGLERQLAAVCRKVARKAAEGDVATVSVTKRTLARLIGSPPFPSELDSQKSEVGVVKGLAWTEAGGELLYLEATLAPGKGLVLTGHLGDVMKESGQTALGYARSILADLQVDEDLLARSEVHVHVPNGATPKDGPSAGVSIATAIVSAATGIEVRGDVAMTGEVTLRGRVLPVGGVREKALAALRAGITRVIVPKQCLKDIEAIPKEQRRKLTFVPVTHMKEVLDEALCEEPHWRRRKRRVGTPSPSAAPAA